jgi:hypothetical protein
MPKSKITQKKVEKIVSSMINKTQELKVKYTELDEVITSMGGQNMFTDFTNVSQGNAPNQRIGDKIRPKRLIVEGWLRPKKLTSDLGTENFQTAGYSRLALLRQGVDVRVDSNIDSDPAPVAMDTTRLFLGNGGRVASYQGDYKDIIRPWNYKVVRPPNKGCDKTYFFSMQAGMNNTRRFKYVVNFKNDDSIEWSTSGAYPTKGLFVLAMLNRYATDDTETAYDVEICGESRFYYYDA